MRIDRTKDVVVENDLIVYVLHISFAHRCISLVQLVFAERKKRKQMGCERKGLFQTQSDMFRYDFGADPAAIGIFFVIFCSDSSESSLRMHGHRIVHLAILTAVILHVQILCVSARIKDQGLLLQIPFSYCSQENM